MKDFFEDYGLIIILIATICAILGITGVVETTVEKSYEEISTGISKYIETKELEKEYWQKKIEMLENKNNNL